MAQPTLRPALALLHSAHPLPLPAELALRVAVLLAQWSQRSRSRRALARLDGHLLKDVGLTRDQALDQARRHFWHG